MLHLTPFASTALDRIAALNPSLNAFIAVFDADAMAQAQTLEEELNSRTSSRRAARQHDFHQRSDRREGSATTAASRVRQRHVAREDAAVVSRLREAGAVIIGKCNMHEFALGTTSDESAFGPVRNPHDRSRSPGGSSGGSAAAVAAGMGWASIGTDTGGSIRIPAAACGVVGLKPTFGEIPTTGVVPLSVSLDHVGPDRANRRDAWAVYAALAARRATAGVAVTGRSLRIGETRRVFLEKLDTDVRQRFEEALDRLKTAGAVITDVRTRTRAGHRHDLCQRGSCRKRSRITPSTREGSRRVHRKRPRRG